MEDAASTAIRQLLRQMTKAVRGGLGLTAAGGPRMTSEFFTLGQVQGWWSTAIDQHLTDEVTAAWVAGRTDASDIRISSRSMDAAGEYVATVRDRLSRTATPTIADGAFDAVRVGLAQELSLGSSTQTIARRLSAELNWHGQDVGFWEQRKALLDSQIDAVLDPLGPPGTPAREAARLNDPGIRDLQQQRSEAVRRLDRDQSVWQTRATRIARTETTGAYNAGALNGYMEEGAGVKVWIATPDEATREDHLEAWGQCVPVAEPFRVGGSFLMFPGDPRGEAGQVVNCRCTTISGRTCEEVGGWLGATRMTVQAPTPAAPPVDWSSPPALPNRLTPFEGGMSPEVLEGYRLWILGDTQPTMARYMREGVWPSDIPRRMADPAVAAIDKFATAQATQSDGVLYRGLTLTRAPSPGDLITDRSWLATTSDRSIAQQYAAARSGKRAAAPDINTRVVKKVEGDPYVMEIRVKAGQPVGPGEPGHREWVLPRDTPVRVVEVQGNVIVAEVVG